MVLKKIEYYFHKEEKTPLPDDVPTILALLPIFILLHVSGLCTLLACFVDDVKWSLRLAKIAKFCSTMMYSEMIGIILYNGYQGAPKIPQILWGNRFMYLEFITCTSELSNFTWFTYLPSLLKNWKEN